MAVKLTFQGGSSIYMNVNPIRLGWNVRMHTNGYIGKIKKTLFQITFLGNSCRWRWLTSNWRGWLHNLVFTGIERHMSKEADSKYPSMLASQRPDKCHRKADVDGWDWVVVEAKKRCLTSSGNHRIELNGFPNKSHWRATSSHDMIEIDLWMWYNCWWEWSPYPSIHALFH